MCALGDLCRPLARLAPPARFTRRWEAGKTYDTAGPSVFKEILSRQARQVFDSGRFLLQNYSNQSDKHKVLDFHLLVAVQPH